MKMSILDKNTLTTIKKFTDKYGKSALITALQNYDSLHQVYIYKTKTCTKRIPLHSINYIEIFGHNVIIHTVNDILKKYGTLTNEYAFLKKHGFIKCNQSLLVPINKIIEINAHFLILETGDKFSLSRSYASEVIRAYVRNDLKS